MKVKVLRTIHFPVVKRNSNLILAGSLESDFNVRSKGNPDESHPDTIQIRDAC